VLTAPLLSSFGVTRLLCKSANASQVGLIKAFNCGVCLPGDRCITFMEVTMIWLIGIALMFGAIVASMMLFRRRLDVLTGPWIMRE
jgi:hypothetical protein